MPKTIPTLSLFLFLAGGAATALAQDDGEIEALRRAASQTVRQTSDGGPSAMPGAAGTTGQSSPNLFNPRITVFGDFVADSGFDSRANLRELELDLRADVDPYSKAVVIAAWGSDEPGELGGEALAEEGYLLFDSLPWNLKLQVGRFLSQFGAINRVHVHDYPWTTLPAPVEKYLGEEGYHEQGAALDSLWGKPLGGVLRHRIEITNGETHPFLAQQLAGESTKPAYVNRFSWFRDTGSSSYLEIGASHLFGNNDLASKQETQLAGADFLWKWKHPRFGSFRSLVLQGEYFALSVENGSPNKVESAGWYGFAQYQLDSRWYAGLRMDEVEDPTAANAKEKVQAAYLSYYTTEFCRFRLGFEHHDRGELGLEDLDAFVFQLTFVFGAHPTEPYWVNR